MNPGSHDWAKRFLMSPAWAFFSSPAADNFPFVFPPKCPLETGVSCLNSSGTNLVTNIEELMDATTDLEDGNSQFNSPSTEQREIFPSTGPWSTSLLNKAGKLKISKDDPSLRSSCRLKDRNKGFKESEKLSEPPLLRNKKASAPRGKKPVIKKKPKDGDDDN